MNENNTLTLTDERQAFELLKKALRDELKDDNIVLKFEGWPVLEIELEGPGYKSTITAEMAEALVAIQAALNRSYALIAKGQSSARHLTDAEKQSIQFKAKVEDGCSLVKIDLGEFAAKLAEATVGKMTGTEVVIAVIGTAAAFGSVVAYKAFLRHQTENKRIEKEAAHAIAMSQEETKRHQILADALAVDRRLEYVRADADLARSEILRGVSDADTITVAGVELSRVAAGAAVRKEREESKAVQLNGTYTVSEASFKQEDATKIYVRSVDDGREFGATFKDDSLDQKQLQLLKDAAFGKNQVYLSINGRLLRGDVTSAEIISVTSQPEE